MIFVYKISPTKLCIECDDRDLLHLIYLRLKGIYCYD